MKGSEFANLHSVDLTLLYRFVTYFVVVVSMCNHDNIMLLNIYVVNIYVLNPSTFRFDHI